MSSSDSCLHRGLVGAALLLSASATQAAAESWILHAGGEVDAESGYRLDAGALWIPAEATTVSAQVGRSDSSTDLDQFTSTSVALGVDHRFGLLGVSLEGRWREDSDFLQAGSIGGSLYLKSGPWRIAARLESRGTDFEPQSFEDVVITRQGMPIVVSATSHCELDNTGYGASWSFDAGAWNVGLSGMRYDYSDADCQLTDLSPPSLGRSLRARANVLPQLAPRLAEFQRLHRSGVTRESTFLESAVSLTVGLEDGERSWEVSYFHDREQFEDLRSDTLLGALTLPLGERSDVELRLGVTDSDLVGTVAFAGFTVFAYLGGL